MATQTLDGAGRAPQRQVSRPKFFFSYSVVLLALVLLGFAPTFYLRAFFDVPTIPPQVYLHGAIMTGWFALLVIQSGLVRGGNQKAHRRLGRWGGIFAVVVVLAGVGLNFEAIGRRRPMFQSDQAMIEAIGVPFFGNLLSMAFFGALVAGAILMRNKPDWHRRLMVLASLNMLPQAISRASSWPYFESIGGLLIPATLFALIAWMLGYDIVTRRRPHPATFIGLATALVAGSAALALAQSAVGRSFIALFM